MHTNNISEIMFDLIPLLDKKFVRPMEQQFRTILSSLQANVLSLLAEKNATMTELSTAMFMSKQQMTPIVDKLVAKNLVQRQYDNDDRRSITISITPAGVQMLATIKEHALKIVEDKFKSLDDADTRYLYKALTDVSRIIHKVP